MTKLRLFAVAAVAALVVAGCGGDDDNQSAGYSDFSQQVNQVCQDVNPDIEATTKKLTGKAKADAAVYDELVPKLEDATNKVKALDAPDELKADFDRFNSTNEQQVELAKKAQAAAKSGNQKGYVAALKEIQQSPLDAQSNEAASKLGAGDCIT